MVKKYFRKFLESKFFNDYRKELLKTLPIETEFVRSLSETLAFVDPPNDGTQDPAFGRRIRK